MKSPATVLTAFVMERLENEPLARRCKLTRALADLCPSPNEADTLRNIANDLESVEARTRTVRAEFLNRHGAALTN